MTEARVIAGLLLAGWLACAAGAAAEEPPAPRAAETNPADATLLDRLFQSVAGEVFAQDDAAAAPPAPAAEAEKKDAPKKKWFEKLNVRGYTQFRLNEIVSEDGAAAQHPGDRSIGDDQGFLVRRARIILFGDVSEHLSVYVQPDFASNVPGSSDANHFAQLRDVYGDVHLDTGREHRFRIGLSKVPYGWENLQSSQNRIPLDRNDAFNSATKNERDLGVFYYWTPKYAQDLFKRVMDENLKGSGNYGVFGIGLYNGQGGSFFEQNDNLHLVSRLTVPYQFGNGQIVEVGGQGLTGKYAVSGSAIRPLGLGEEAVRPAGTIEEGNRNGVREERYGATFVLYPQPIGVQAEWTWGKGPALNDEQTRIVRRDLDGGYVQVHYKLDDFHGTWFPFVRWNRFEGGYRSEKNAPYADIDEIDAGLEWQIRPEMELAFVYSHTDRTNLSAAAGEGAVSYRAFEGDVLRFQFQINY